MKFHYVCPTHGTLTGYRPGNSTTCAVAIGYRCPEHGLISFENVHYTGGDERKYVHGKCNFPLTLKYCEQALRKLPIPAERRWQRNKRKPLLSFIWPFNLLKVKEKKS